MASALFPASNETLLFRMVVAAFVIRTVAVAMVFRGLVDPSIHFGEFGAEIGWTARSIAAGYGYSSPFWPITGPTALVPPGYTYLLAGVFRLFGLYTAQSAFAVLLLNSMFSALTCIPVFLIARETADTRTARLAGWAWVVYPFSIFYSAQVWEYAPTALLFATCFYLLLRLHGDRRIVAWTGFGLLYGATALVNPAILAVLPFLFLLVLLRLRQHGQPWMVKTVATTLTVVAVLAPWTAYVSRRMHTFVPIRDGYWLEFYAGNNGDSFRSNAIWAHPATNDAEMRAYEALGETAYLASKHRLAAEFVREHPVWFATATLRRIFRYWTGFWSFSRRYLQVEPLDVPNFFFCTAITIFMLRGLSRLWRANRPAARMFVAVLGVFPVTYYLSHASMDYRQPIESMIVVLAVVGLVEPADKSAHPR
jgi:hypothetical protein